MGIFYADVNVFSGKMKKMTVAAFSFIPEISMVQACYLKKIFVDFFPEYKWNGRFSGTPQVVNFRTTLEPFVWFSVYSIIHDS